MSSRQDHLCDTTLSVKQVDTTAVGELARYALRTALLAYYKGPEADVIRKGQTTLRKFFGRRIKSEVDPTVTRRFAGDRTLPRSRYYSLVDATSVDHGTLLREICAYLLRCPYRGLVSLFETEGANTMELLAVLATIPKRNYRHLDLAAPSLLIALRPLDGDDVLRKAYGRGSHYVVQVPYLISTEVLHNVIDLRRPAARAWIVEQFKSTVRLGARDFPMMLGGRRPPVDFSELLPSLLDQSLGGGWTSGGMM